MNQYGIVVDSTVYLDEEFLKKYDIKVVSLKVTIDQVTYDEKDITREFIIDKRKQGSKFQTSAPAPGAFIEAYEEMLKTYKHVFVIGLSKELSGTYQSSVLGKNMLADASKVTVFDTNGSAYGNELLVHRLVSLLDEAMTVAKIEEKMKQYIENETLMFTCENLFSLVSGGRLSGARAMIGTVLRVKPIIEMKEGKLIHIKSERTYSKVFDLMKERIDATTKGHQKLYFYITNTNSEKSGDLLVEYIKNTYPKASIIATDLLGPVMTVHVGNKGFGLAWTYE